MIRFRLALALFGLLAATAAQADDWSGAYLGISAGRLAGKSTWTTTQLSTVCPDNCFSDLTADLSANGVYYGGHLGYNWALGRWVLLGIEAGAGNSNASGNIDHVPGYRPENSIDRITADYGLSYSVVGRFGFTAGPVLLYGLAGPSWQKMSLRVDCPSPDPVSWCGIPRTETDSSMRSGWTAGGGLEFQLPWRLNARLDYRYAKYKDKDHVFFAASEDGEQIYAKTSLKTSVVTLGVSYRF
jgi:opacity protein-like surface antigen